MKGFIFCKFSVKRGFYIDLSEKVLKYYSNMFFTWIFSIISLVSLVVGKFFFVISPDTNSLLLALALIASAPWIPLVFAHIRADMAPLHSLTTRSALVWYGLLIFTWTILSFVLDTETSTQIFFLILIFATYFHIDARIFFAVALGGLITTIWGLAFDMSAWAESASIIVYLSLVISVFVEISSRLIDRLHYRSRELVSLSSEFKTSYRKALSEYAWIITVILQSSFIIGLLGRGTFWNFEYSMLLYISFGIWIFFAIYLFASEKIYSLRDFVTNRFSIRYIIWLVKKISQYSRYIVTVIIFSILVTLIDWTLVLRLPLITLVSLIGLMAFLIGISVYSIVSFFYRR